MTEEQKEECINYIKTKLNITIFDISNMKDFLFYVLEHLDEFKDITIIEKFNRDQLTLEKQKQLNILQAQVDLLKSELGIV